jgi:hypothetical protein
MVETAPVRIVVPVQLDSMVQRVRMRFVRRSAEMRVTVLLRTFVHVRVVGRVQFAPRVSVECSMSIDVDYCLSLAVCSPGCQNNGTCVRSDTSRKCLILFAVYVDRTQ